MWFGRRRGPPKSGNACHVDLSVLLGTLMFQPSIIVNAEVSPVPCNGREIQEIIQEMPEADAME